MELTDNNTESGMLEQMCVDFLNRSGAEPDAVGLCQNLIRNMNKGDTCLELDEAQTEIISRCSFVSTAPESSGLFILDGKKIFTRRNWIYEQAVRAKLASMQGKIAENTVIPDDPVFSKLHDCQKKAVKMMVENRFSILTGGPGTGKTYTIARAVKLALQNGALRIGLAAPTGKAAARVNETMEQEIQTLGLTGIEKAVTVHSLLESTYTSVNFKHNHDNPLDLDWMIVDESSMIDLPLMAKLLDALPPECRLTLVGDEYQLASVERGHVFSDLCRFPEIPKCELNQSTRFPEGGIIDRFAKAINAGNENAVLQALADGDDLLHFTEFSGPDAVSQRYWPDFPEMILQLFGDFASQTDPAEALKCLNRCRILCAIRPSLYGMDRLNEYVTRLLNRHFPNSPVPVMVTRNNKELGVSNGDVGVVMPGDNHLYLPASGEQTIRPIPLELLPETETAFATTIHKAQGSEYTDVVIVLPSDSSLFQFPKIQAMLTRELLYTAVTRTKKKIYLFSGREAIIQCCRTRIIRKTGLNRVK